MEGQKQYTVYVLEDGDGRRYKGMTNNLTRRLKEHKLGKTKTTKKMYNVRVVYSENNLSRGQARTRELYLKSAAGRRYLKNIGL